LHCLSANVDFMMFFGNATVRIPLYAFRRKNEKEWWKSTSNNL